MRREMEKRVPRFFEPSGCRFWEKFHTGERNVLGYRDVASTCVSWRRKRRRRRRGGRRMEEEEEVN